MREKDMFTDNETLIKDNHDYKSWKIKKTKISKNGTLRIIVKEEFFGGKQVREILTSLNFSLKKYGKKLRRVEFIFSKFRPADKMSYIMLEIIIFLLKEKYNIEIGLNGTLDTDINTYGLLESILADFGTRKISNTDFLDMFKKKNRLKSRSMRKIISCNDVSEISILMSEVKSFLKVFEICEEDRKNISRVVCELADNACEHAKNDCLVDIDVSNPHKKKGDEIGEYYAVNICILNFSNILLGEKVKNKILNSDYSEKGEQYKKIYDAYTIHKQLFDKTYTEEHFFLMASFQNEISGRDFETETGGKGLAEIVGELEKTVDQYSCYVLSGKNGIAFHPNTLEIDQNGWISFNCKKDFLNHRPDKEVVLYSDTYLPGTGYNLSIVYKKER